MSLEMFQTSGILLHHGKTALTLSCGNLKISEFLQQWTGTGLWPMASLSQKVETLLSWPYIQNTEG